MSIIPSYSKWCQRRDIIEYKKLQEEGCIINKIVLYTDAGCADKRGGFAFLIRFQEKNKKQILGFGCFETDNSLLAELIAIKRALEYIAFHDLSQYEIELNCDVISIINFFNENIYKKFLDGEGMVRYKKFVKSNMTVLPDIVGLIDSLNVPNIKFIKVKSKKDRYNNIVHTYAAFARSLYKAGRECTYLYELHKIYGLDDVISTNNYAVNYDVINTEEFK